MINNKARLRINLWLEQEDSILFGMGRYILLKKVEEHGSLKQAAQSMNMSYRAAWGKMKQSEEILGHALIEKHGSNRTGYQLTSFGKEIMEQYKQWLDDVESYALERSMKYLNYEITKFHE